MLGFETLLGSTKGQLHQVDWFGGPGCGWFGDLSCSQDLVEKNRCTSGGKIVEGWLILRAFSKEVWKECVVVFVCAEAVVDVVAAEWLQVELTSCPKGCIDSSASDYSQLGQGLTRSWVSVKTEGLFLRWIKILLINRIKSVLTWGGWSASEMEICSNSNDLILWLYAFNKILLMTFLTSFSKLGSVVESGAW